MATPRFYNLKVKEVRPETADCVSVALEVPEDMQELFRFQPGQYLTFRKHFEDAEVRRSYSICTSPSKGELRVAIKAVQNGRFSGYANSGLQAGEILEVMPPMGRFTPKLTDKKSKNYLAFAAGSGITPVMSIMSTVLEQDPECSFTLVFGNRSRNTIIFREAIEDLKNQYMNRLRLYHVLSREIMDVPLFNGRIDGEKAGLFCEKLIDLRSIDEVFLCGPEEMILSVREKLLTLDMPSAHIHMELFASPDQPSVKHEQWVKEHEETTGPVSKVSITLDAVTFDLDLAYNGASVLDAALAAGADLPYACKGGVCSTCRARLMEGEVEMEVNYALEADEVANGYILTCQSHPRTARVVVDFDAR